jgi:hypothetical protein
MTADNQIHHVAGHHRPIARTHTSSASLAPSSSIKGTRQPSGPPLARWRWSAVALEQGRGGGAGEGWCGPTAGWGREQGRPWRRERRVARRRPAHRLVAPIGSGVAAAAEKREEERRRRGMVEEDVNVEENKN